MIHRLRQRSFGIMIILLLNVIIIGCSFRTRNDVSVDGLIADSYIFDFGDVDQSTHNIHPFLVTNNSSDELQVVEIKSSCTCTVVADQMKFESPLATGESRLLSASLDANGYSDKAKGKIMLKYLRPGTTTVRTLTLGLIARVRSDYLFPTEIDMGELGVGPRSQSSFDVDLQSVSEANPIALVSASCSDPNVVTTRVSASKYLLTYSAELTGTARNIRIPVVFETTSRTKPRSVVYLVGKFIPEVSISPQMVVIGSDQSGIHGQVLQVCTRFRSRVSLKGLSDTLIRANYDCNQFGLDHTINLEILDIGKRFSTELQLCCESSEGGVISSQIIVCRFSR